MSLTRESILKGRLLEKSSYKDGCWIWKASTVRPKKSAYGQMWDGKRLQLAHRLSYTLNVGRIPKGKTINHECGNTLCVNPQHLSVMSLRDNILLGSGPSAINARKRRCTKGHKFNHLKNGNRECPICKLEWQRRKRNV